MKRKGYLESNVFLERERKIQLQRHKQRLQEISKKADKKIIKQKLKKVYGKDIGILKQMHDQRRKDFEFKMIQNNMKLNKENQILLDRLLHVHKDGK